MASKEQELQELAELEELAKLEELAAKETQQQMPETPMTAKDYLLKGADVAGSALDYLGGLSRGAIGGAAEAVTGKDIVNIQDVLKGKAPTSSEMMEKIGVPEGYSLSEMIPEMYSETGEGALKFQKGGLFDPSARGAAGLAMDIATDPLTYATGGLSTLAKFGKLGETLKKGIQSKPVQAALTPVGTISGTRSKQLYKKAFETVDTNLKPLNKPYSISDILSKEKFKGNMMEATEKVSEINKKAGSEIGSILKEASQKGAKVDMMKEFQPALDYAQELRSMPTPEAAKLADDIDNRIMFAWQKSGGTMPVDKANELKSFINDQIKASGFAAGDEAALSAQARKAVAGDLSEGIKNAVKNADPELAKTLSEQNKLYSSTSDKVQEEMFKQAKTVKQLNEQGVIPQISQVDLMLAGAGALSGGPVGWLPLIAKKAGQAAMTTKGRTSRAAFGKFLEEQKNIVDPVLRQALWVDMLKQEEQP